MSSDADDGGDTIVPLFASFYTEQYCIVATAALFLYEVSVTFDREVACFWTSKAIGSSLLFFSNKWISVVVSVMSLAQFESFSTDESCSLFVRAATAVQILQFIPWAAFSALRAFVLSKSKLLGLLVLALSLSPVGANLVEYGYQLAGGNVPPLGCVAADNTTPEISLINGTGVIVARVPLIVADVLLVYITWTRLSSRDALRDIRQSKRLSLSDILFRDGMIYFVVLFILNVLHLTFSLTSVAMDLSGSFLPIFTGPVTAILVSRFLLELQEANQTVVRLDPDDPLQFSRDPYDGTPSFITSIGAFINPDLPAPDDEELEREPHSQIGSGLVWEEEDGAHDAPASASSNAV